MKNNLIVRENESRVAGVLSGWDRLVFRGCGTMLSYLDAMLLWTLRVGILLKDYSERALALSQEMKQACRREAKLNDRPVQYLASSGVRKDELAGRFSKSPPFQKG